MNEDGTLFRKHFQSGQNINIYSLDAEHEFIVKHVEHEHIDRNGVEGLVFSDEWDRPLREFVAENYRDILTRKQIEYAVMTHEERYSKYDSSCRRHYRERMGKRFTLNLLGLDVPYYNRIDTHLRHLRHINQYRDVADDNKAFSDLLKQQINEPYIQELVYERLSDESRRWVTRAIRYEIDVKAVALYEVYDLLMQDMDSLYELVAKLASTKQK